MRLAVIACQALYRELSLVCAESPSVTTVWWLPQGLHDSPETLRTRVQGLIEEIEREDEEAPVWRKFDAVALGYGLCGGGTAGLRARRLPLVIPRTDDCIGILLGSQARYLERVRQGEGISGLSGGWLEWANLPGKDYYGEKLRAYEERYGAEEAEWLLTQENSWIGAYRDCVLIEGTEEAARAEYARRAQEIADACGWRLERMQGDLSLLSDLLKGGWNERYCVCPPGAAIARSYDESIFN